MPIPMNNPTGGSQFPLTAEGIWLSVNRSPFPQPVPALFLDRDGVVVVDTEFIADPNDVSLMDGAANLVARAGASGLAVVVVTNQSGIDRGLYGWAEFASVEAEIAGQLASAGAGTDAVVACPFHPEFTAGYGATHAGWRKPGAGMLRLAGTTLNIDMSRSWMVGDRVTDIAAGREAGLAGGIFVAGKEGERAADAQALAGPGFTVEICRDIAAAEAALEKCGLLAAGGRSG